MKFFLPVILIFWINISGCRDSTNKAIREILEKRNELVSLFSKKSIFRTGTGRFIFLHTYNGDKKNDYVFTLDQGGNYSLFRDKTMFIPDTILKINKNDLSRSIYKKQLFDKIDFYCKKMDSLHISDIDSEFSPQGIDLKIYLKSRGIVVYVSEKVVNNEWQQYVQSMKKFDDHWYYSANKEVNR